MGLVAVAATAVLVAGCFRPWRRPPATTTTVAPTTTTTVPTTAPTTTVGDHGTDHDHGPAGDDKGWSLLSNGHQDEHGAAPLDAATQAALDRQLAVSRQLVDRYPTVARAEADGYTRAGPFLPGLGTHLVSFTTVGQHAVGPGPITDDQILHPILIFDGWTPEAPLIGFMYLSLGTTVPEGFAGPNDHWHYHTNVCLTWGPDGLNTPLGSDRELTQEECQAIGGRLMPFTGYMVHAWTVPGWENPDGVFAELNPRVTCKDGTYWTIPFEKVGTNKTQCRDEAVIG